MKIKYTIKKPVELDKISQEIIKNFSNKKIFLFKGNIGAGKTTTIKYFLKNMNLEERVTSPTFLFKKSYNRFSHYDLYMLEKKDIKSIIFMIDEDLNENKLVFVEWPGKINFKKYFNDLLVIDIKKMENDVREINIIN